MISCLSIILDCTACAGVWDYDLLFEHNIGLHCMCGCLGCLSIKLYSKVSPAVQSTSRAINNRRTWSFSGHFTDLADQTATYKVTMSCHITNKIYPTPLSPPCKEECGKVTLQKFALNLWLRLKVDVTTVTSGLGANSV